jgi:hypothetical protein
MSAERREGGKSTGSMHSKGTAPEEPGEDKREYGGQKGVQKTKGSTVYARQAKARDIRRG